jgi:N-acetylglucosaminylphosphatidylinositol deacetylase
MLFGLILIAVCSLVACRVLIIWTALSRQVNSNTLQLLGGHRSVLLVFAHPDDEAMFFTPALHALRSSGAAVHFLCFSSGNYAGLGEVRKNELAASAGVYGASSWTVVEDARTFDGPSPWDIDFISDRTADFLRQRREIDCVMTFDDRGVSGHSNHLDVHQGIRRLSLLQHKYSLQRPVAFYQLHTRPLWRKYSGPLELLRWSSSTTASPLTAERSPSRLRFLVPLPEAMLSLRGMKAHKSQLVWFRYLFVFFSQYGFMNEFHAIDA